MTNNFELHDRPPLVRMQAPHVQQVLTTAVNLNAREFNRSAPQLTRPAMSFSFSAMNARQDSLLELICRASAEIPRKTSSLIRPASGPCDQCRDLPHPPLPDPPLACPR